MCQFPLFETIAIIDGKIQQLFYHQQRVDFAFKHYFQHAPTLNLAEKIVVPKAFHCGLVRARVNYSPKQSEIFFYPYVPRQIQRFHLVETENLDYRFKYTDRKRLDLLKNLPNFQAESDEIIIINNGFISDCTIGNLLLKKDHRWFSPRHYLLKGTQLTALLAEGKVTLCDIPSKALWKFEQIMLINALNPFDEKRAVPITSGRILK
ncbi:branched-chain amino acid aminotransferase [Pasteurellaceae bacterium Macca]|nr:branched-chain amino acid aminotransferase [Pasteurellaceae bacterium Macca]